MVPSMGPVIVLIADRNDPAPFEIGRRCPGSIVSSEYIL